MNKTKGFLYAAGMVFAMAFTFSCSSDGGSGGGSSSGEEAGEPSSSSGNEEPSSSSAVPSSSSAPPSSSSEAASSSSVAPSSSSSVEHGTSSSETMSSSSEAESSSSVAPSSSSAVPSSSSAPPSSSSVAPSSSSSVPSSSSSGGGNTCSADFGEVTIGSQVWAKKNLNCDVEGSKCYDDDLANCAEYGRLYDWETALTVCPSGWHLPSDAEWTTLTDYVGSDAGTKLKATSGWATDHGIDGNGTDAYGFSALPGGYGNSGGSFYVSTIVGYWWSATETSASNAYYRNMLSTLSNVSGGGNSGSNKSNLYSVRCVKD